jgi:hypothetical protein
VVVSSTSNLVFDFLVIEQELLSSDILYAYKWIAVSRPASNGAEISCLDGLIWTLHLRRRLQRLRQQHNLQQ